MLLILQKGFIFAPVQTATETAQRVEHHPAEIGVASPSLVFRSSRRGCSNGGIGRHEGLKIPWALCLCGFKSRFEYLQHLRIVRSRSRFRSKGRRDAKNRYPHFIPCSEAIKIALS